MNDKASMHVLRHEDYLALRQGAEVIEADGHGDKVLLLRDGNYLKLFRRKRFLTSASFYPYAQRFADNLRALAERDIPCPEIIGLYRIRAIARDAVHYRPLAGHTLRHIARSAPDATEADRLRAALGEFVAKLHMCGVYFRSLHLGNIVLTADNRLGLIDVADLIPHKHPLGRILRNRNMRHLLRYAEEGTWLCAGGIFFAAYNHHSGHHLTP